MSSIVVSGDTSGAVTLSAPAVAGTVTVTLPSASGTMASLASVTANGVSYVNSSGQPTSGSALTFDGSKLTVSSSVEQFKLLSSGDFSSTGTGYLRFYDSVGAKGYLGYAGTAGRMDLQSGLGMNLNFNGAGGVTTFATSNTERARFNSTGALVFAGGTTTADGIGITFPATQSASSDANTLDDYEEGTFTPVISGTSTAGTGTYSVQNGAYVKIGKMVQYQIYLVLTAHTGTGDITIGGLPFTASANYYPPTAIYVNNLALTALNYPQAAVSTASTNFLVRQVPTGGGAVSTIPMDTAFDILLSGTYQV